jgi:hypothetical protein
MIMVGPSFSKAPVPYTPPHVCFSPTKLVAVEVVCVVRLLVFRSNSTIRTSQTTLQVTEEVCLATVLRFSLILF